MKNLEALLSPCSALRVPTGLALKALRCVSYVDPHSRRSLRGWAETRRKKLCSVPKPLACEMTGKRDPTFVFSRSKSMLKPGRGQRASLPSRLFCCSRRKGADAGCGGAAAARMHRRNLQGRARTPSGDSQSRRCAQSLPLSSS